MGSFGIPTEFVSALYKLRQTSNHFASVEQSEIRHASAPDEVVEEARANLAEREEEEAQLKAAMDRLNEI